jgi:hypothetical protein
MGERQGGHESYGGGDHGTADREAHGPPRAVAGGSRPPRDDRATCDNRLQGKSQHIADEDHAEQRRQRPVAFRPEPPRRDEVEQVPKAVRDRQRPDDRCPAATCAHVRSR